MIETTLAHGTHRFPWDHVRTDGEVFPVEVAMTAMPSAEGTLLLAVLRDVSARFQAEVRRTLPAPVSEVPEDILRRSDERFRRPPAEDPEPIRNYIEESASSELVLPEVANQDQEPLEDTVVAVAEVKLKDPLRRTRAMRALHSDPPKDEDERRFKAPILE